MVIGTESMAMEARDSLELTPTGSPPDQCRRATYVLERGVWRATCNACGQQFADPDRRRLNQVFRCHVQERRDMIVLTDHTAAPVLSVSEVTPSLSST